MDPGASQTHRQATSLLLDKAIPAQDPVKVTVESATGATQSTTAPPNTITSFGESANPPTSDVTLVELRVS
ncbi:hypothetical protein ACIGEZ_19760 [Streptomyces sp. NPDC085481]|uniref:hypothetical protein n=1 Tax=Streptomyces sp. NPDC085481 TaxID=3365727 RepID=UPI0037D3FD20